MKIVQLCVEELITKGVYFKPHIVLTLDKDPREAYEYRSIQQADAEERIRVEGYKYSFLADMRVLGTDLDRPLWLNTYFPGRPWVHVRVNGSHPEYQWYMPLDRARKELNKSCPGWELVVDDHFAVAGQIVWRLREKLLTCKARSETGNPKQAFCGGLAVHEIRRGDYYIPLCRDHLDRFTAEAARKRIK